MITSTRIKAAVEFHDRKRDKRGSRSRSQSRSHGH